MILLQIGKIQQKKTEKTDKTETKARFLVDFGLVFDDWVEFM